VPTAFGGLRFLLVGGDALDPTAARLVLTGGAPPRQLINAYGPTEATTMVLFQRITEVPEETQRIPIGEPVTGAVVKLLDEQLQPVPVGTPGELHIGGLGLARGYVNAPEETGAKFVQTPFGRLYKTGDLAQQLLDGSYDFLGRRDQQVKVRGFRIELTEIEAAIRKVIRVGECRVLARDVSPGDRRILAYFTRDRARPLPSDTLRTELGRLLPEYMIPSAFIEVAGFPLTPNGKLAVDELPLVEPSQGQASALLESQNTLHSALIEIWQEVLERRPIGIRDDFFEIGGHSLLAIRMLTLVEQRLGARPELQTLFEEATIEHLAVSMLNELQETAGHEPYVSMHTEGKRAPFFFLHGDFAGGGFFSRGLAEEIGADRPFYAIHPHGLQGDPPPRSVAVMAADRLATIRKIQPHGPYLLGGYCNGALVAFEIARRLEAEGERVPAVILLMASGSNYRRRHWQRLAALVSAFLREEPAQQEQRFLQWSRRAAFALAGVRDFLHASGRDQFRRSTRRLRRLFGQVPQPPSEPEPAPEPPTQEQQFWDLYLDASESYVPSRFGGRLILLWPRDEPVQGGHNPAAGWDAVSPDVQLVFVPGNHDTSITRNSNLLVAGQEMRRALEQLDHEMASPSLSSLAHA
jgi:thioesterase domain-containing protein